MTAERNYPRWFSDCIMSNEDAYRTLVKSGSRIGSGFATSEPHSFYAGLWDHILKADIHDLLIRQALFLAPHRLCVGDAMQSKGFFAGAAKGSLLSKVNMATRKLEGLKRLIDHYEEMRRRRIVIVSPFIGAATNILIPDNAITRTLYPDYVGRNTTRMGITDMQSVHFPDGVESLAYDGDENPKLDTYAIVMTPPDENGEMSHGPASGGNTDIVERILRLKNTNILLYVNPRYPFTRGYGDARNTLHIDEFKPLAELGKLFVVEDNAKVPSMPSGSFLNPPKAELQIAENVVNHMEMNKQETHGRAIQVGFGGTGVLAIKKLKESSWTGRNYSEMLEPFTLDLFEAGRITGSHFIERDGRRVQLDGKIVATFTICEDDSDFYSRLHNNPAIILSSAARVVIPEGFYGGLGINNCLSIDFNGHVNSGGRYRNHHSGVGGGAMIHRGLLRGGIAYLVLKSTFTDMQGERRSAIVPFLPEGSPISHIGPDLIGSLHGAKVFIVTEHGVARVSAKSQSEMVKALIGIAHPDFRDELAKAAWKEYRISV